MSPSQSNEINPEILSQVKANMSLVQEENKINPNPCDDSKIRDFHNTSENIRKLEEGFESE